MGKRDAFYAAIRGTGKLFPVLSDAQFKGIEAIYDCWDADPKKLYELRHLAYCMATAYHETDRHMTPIAEYGAGHGKPYGQPSAPYGKIYFGRGLVQLTWWYNYVKAQIELGDMGIQLDLVRLPELALSTKGAPQILIYGMLRGWFSGHKLTDYFNHSADDAIGARHIVNGSDRASLIAGYHTQFLSALRAS